MSPDSTDGVTATAVAFADRLTSRWQGFLPFPSAKELPGGVLTERGYAYPAFRNPLAYDQTAAAGAQFHADVVERLTVGPEFTVLTFDYELESEGSSRYEQSALDGLLQRQRFSRVGSKPEANETEITHGYLSVLESGAPELKLVYEYAATGIGPVVRAGPDLDWLAYIFEEIVVVYSFSARDLLSVRAGETASWRRWGIERDRAPSIESSIEYRRI